MRDQSLEHHNEQNVAVTSRWINVRSSFDWKGKRGIELFINNEKTTVFASSFKNALQDLLDSDTSHWDQYQCQMSNIIFMIQPPMGLDEKNEIDAEIQEWAVDIS